LLREAEARATDIITAHKPQIDILIKRLEDKETLDQAEIQQILKQEPPLKDISALSN